jgi:hypothetical protein
MKRISLISRIVTLLLAGMFPLAVVGDGYGLHPCPHHDSPTVQSTHVAAEGHHPAAPPAAPADSGDSHGDHGPCTCIGGCSAPVGVALPGLGLRTAQAASVVRPWTATHAATLDFSPPSFLLPYATAPPV